MVKFFGCLILLASFLFVSAQPITQPDIDKLQKEVEYLQKKLDLETKRVDISKQLLQLDGNRSDPVADKLDLLLAEAKVTNTWLKSIDGKLGNIPTPPTPPTPVVTNPAVDITFIGERTPTSANNVFLKWLRDNGVTPYELATPTPSFKDSVDKVGGLPCFVLRDKDHKILSSSPSLSVTDSQKFISKYINSKN